MLQLISGLKSHFLCLLSRQLLTQCNTRFVECFSAHKDCNKEKNRNSSVVPCEYSPQHAAVELRLGATKVKLNM